MKKRLNILKNGIIAGGHAEYEILAGGYVRYSGEIRAKIGFFTKKHPFSGEEHIGEEGLLSSSYDNVSKKPKLHNAEAEIISVVGKDSLVNLYIKDADARGKVTVDISEKNISIKHAELKANALGFRLVVRLQS
jgi:hypothetical protein